MSNFTFLTSINISKTCLLSEALYWRSFGRVPEEIYDLEGEPWRANFDYTEDIFLEIPSGENLELEECQFAEIPIDPRTSALFNETATDSIEQYEKTLDLLMNKPQEERDKFTEKCIINTRESLEEARKFHSEFKDFNRELENYLDQFKSEVCLDLRRGHLIATGRQLPSHDINIANQLLEDGDWLDTIEASPIPASTWISSDVNWMGSAVLGRNMSFAWITLDVNDLLNRYPAQELIHSRDLVD